MFYIFKFYLAKPRHLHQNKYQTELLPVEIAQVLKDSHYNVFRKYPSNNRLAMAWAQIALENGQGEKIYNYNLGNIGAGKHQSYYVVSGSKFRSFNGFEDSGDAYWNVLKNNCSIVLSIFDTGDVSRSATQLENCGYYRVEREIYERGMVRLYNQAIWKILPKLSKAIN